MEFYTMGVYGLKDHEFFGKLLENGIDTFIDIRRRRAVRGSEYVFVNSNRLQNKLKELGINYIHILDLAPTNEIREAQKKADAQTGTAKRTREELGPIFKHKYEKEILEKYDIGQLTDQLVQIGCRKALLFCVERQPNACHRSIVANKLQQLNYSVHHL